MISGYTKDHFVQQPAVQFVQDELGWDVGSTSNIERPTLNVEVGSWNGGILNGRGKVPCERCLDGGA